MTAGSPERQADMARALHAAPAASTAGTAGAEVRFVADLTCPWCFVSFVRLRRLLQPMDAPLIWHPFLLNPHLPPQGIARERYLGRAYGHPLQAQRVLARLEALGRQEGIAFAFAAIRSQPGTDRAHALVLEAAACGRTLEAVETIFRAFFTAGIDIGDLAWLRALAVELGLPAEASARIDDPRALAAVRIAHEQACGLGINGVPICVLGGDHVIAGAQPTAALAALLDVERYRQTLAQEHQAAQGRQAS